MKAIITAIIVFAGMTSLSSAHFLWATKEFWKNSFEGFKITELPKIPSSGAELISIRSVKGSEETEMPYKMVVVFVGDRAMSYNITRDDSEPMTEEDIRYCITGGSDVETKFDKPVQDGDFMTWVRTDEKVIIRYDRVTNTATVSDFAYFMFDLRTIEVSKMKPEGLGATWAEQLKQGK